MPFKTVLILLAGLLFCVSSAGYAMVKIFLKPKENSVLDEIYWEFEESDPALKRYTVWIRVFFTGVIVSMLLLFAAISL